VEQVGDAAAVGGGVHLRDPLPPEFCTEGEDLSVGRIADDGPVVRDVLLRDRDFFHSTNPVLRKEPPLISCSVGTRRGCARDRGQRGRPRPRSAAPAGPSPPPGSGTVRHSSRNSQDSWDFGARSRNIFSNVPISNASIEGYHGRTGHGAHMPDVSTAPLSRLGNLASVTHGRTGRRGAEEAALPSAGRIRQARRGPRPSPAAGPASRRLGDEARGLSATGGAPAAIARARADPPGGGHPARPRRPPADGLDARLEHSFPDARSI